MNNIVKSLKDKLSAIRVIKGELLTDMAKKLGITPSTLSDIENGKYLITENLYSAIKESIIKNYGIDLDKFDEKTSQSDRLADTIRNHKVNNHEVGKDKSNIDKFKEIYDRISREENKGKVSNVPLKRYYYIKYDGIKYVIGCYNFPEDVL